jgi:hypothetical protein
MNIGKPERIHENEPDVVPAPDWPTPEEQPVPVPNWPVPEPVPVREPAEVPA